MNTARKAPPLVSVVIPCYNHENYVQHAIQSVIDQTYKNIELIIIDDGSSDDSVVRIKEMLDACESRFLRFEFRARSNLGVGATLNEALQWSAGKYFSALASDDIMLPEKTSMQVDFLEHNETYGGVFGGVGIIDEKGVNVARPPSRRRSFDFNDILLHRHNLPAPTQMFQAKALKAVGGYRVGVRIEDWNILLLISSAGYRFFNLGQALALYRRHDENLSKRRTVMNDGRAQLLAEFSDHPLHRLAVANSFLAAAYEALPLSRREALGWVARMAMQAPMAVFQISVLKFFLRTTLPAFLNRKLFG